jgi:hypothetical protein
MAKEPALATISIEFGDGNIKRWRFELAPDAPYALEELKDSLVREFAGDGKDSRNFEITASGTVGSPHFALKEKQVYIGNVEQIQL